MKSAVKEAIHNQKRNHLLNKHRVNSSNNSKED